MAIVTTPRSGKCGGFGGGFGGFGGGGFGGGFGGAEQFGFELPISVSIGIPFGGFGGCPCF